MKAGRTALNRAYWARGPAVSAVANSAGSALREAGKEHFFFVRRATHVYRISYVDVLVTRNTDVVHSMGTVFGAVTKKSSVPSEVTLRKVAKSLLFAFLASFLFTL